MKSYTLFIKNVILIAIILVTGITKGQEVSASKFIDINTTYQVKIDFDNDGDLDYVIAGVFPDKNQGRVYLVENKKKKLGKAEYVYSYPTIPVKQHIEVQQKDDLTTIVIIGTDPDGKQTKYMATLFKGEFEGMLSSPIVSNSEL